MEKHISEAMNMPAVPQVSGVAFVSDRESSFQLWREKEGV
jgi:hypothetical protein